MKIIRVSDLEAEAREFIERFGGKGIVADVRRRNPIKREQETAWELFVIQERQIEAADGGLW